MTLLTLCGFGLLVTCTYRANDPSICFSRDVLPIFINNCIGCHGGSGGYTFTSYEGIMKGVKKNHPRESAIYRVIKGNNPKMPPDGHRKLTEQQIFTIKAWISMGAQNTTTCGSCDTSLYAFAADVKPIFNLWCTGGCHTTGQPDGGFDLSNYNGIKSAGTSGKLVPAINHTSGAIPMPQGSSKIPDCDILKIQNWVNAGYPNN